MSNPSSNDLLGALEELRPKNSWLIYILMVLISVILSTLIMISLEDKKGEVVQSTLQQPTEAIEPEKIIEEKNAELTLHFLPQIEFSAESPNIRVNAYMYKDGLPLDQKDVKIELKNQEAAEFLNKFPPVAVTNSSGQAFFDIPINIDAVNNLYASSLAPLPINFEFKVTMEKFSENITIQVSFPRQTDTALDDRDRDGLFDLQEEAAGTSPDMADTDLDGENDGRELLNLKTDPKVSNLSMLDATAARVNFYSSDFPDESAGFLENSVRLFVLPQRQESQPFYLDFLVEESQIYEGKLVGDTQIFSQTGLFWGVVNKPVSVFPLSEQASARKLVRIYGYFVDEVKLSGTRLDLALEQPTIMPTITPTETPTPTITLTATSTPTTPPTATLGPTATQTLTPTLTMTLEPTAEPLCEMGKLDSVANLLTEDTLSSLILGLKPETTCLEITNEIKKDNNDDKYFKVELVVLVPEEFISQDNTLVNSYEKKCFYLIDNELKLVGIFGEKADGIEVEVLDQEEVKKKVYKLIKISGFISDLKIKQ